MEDAWKIICYEYMRVWKYFIPLLGKIKKKKYILRKFLKNGFFIKTILSEKKCTEIKKKCINKINFSCQYFQTNIPLNNQPYWCKIFELRSFEQKYSLGGLQKSKEKQEG